MEIPFFKNPLETTTLPNGDYLFRLANFYIFKKLREVGDGLWYNPRTQTVTNKSGREVSFSFYWPDKKMALDDIHKEWKYLMELFHT